MYLNIDSIFIFATAAPTNRLHPYGGEHNPNARFTAMITPKCTGLIFNASIVGRSIGAITIIAGTVSRKQPITNRIMFININTMYGLSDTPVRNSVIICGTFSNVMNVEKTVE